MSGEGPVVSLGWGSGTEVRKRGSLGKPRCMLMEGLPWMQCGLLA